MRAIDRMLIWLFAWLVVAIFSLPYAAKIGGIWDSQARPTKRVTVQLKSGQQLQGDLVISWNDKFVLTTANGESIEFGQYGEADYLEFEIPVDQRAGPIKDMWRAWVPVYLSGVFCIFVGVFPFLRFYLKSKESVC